MITSFGFSRGDPPRADQTFDVRDEGHDPTTDSFRQRINTIREYGAAHPDQSIAIGCVKGQHRAPTIANAVARALRQSVRHRDWQPSTPRHATYLHTTPHVRDGDRRP